MKKLLLFVILSISLITLTSATPSFCNINNDFTIGEDLNICSGLCKFQNATNLYQDCNASVSCYLTTGYPNGSILGVSLPLSFNFSGENIYNYSFGNLTNTTTFPTGIYSSQLNCFYLGGWSDPLNFEFSVSSADVIFTSQSGAIIQGAFVKIPSANEIKDSILKDFLKKKWHFIVVLALFVLVIVMIYDYRKKKFKKLVSKVAQELR